VDAETAGSISGVVKLDGMPPRMRAINMRSVANCQKMHSTPVMTEDVVVGENGALQNVVVYLKGDFSNYSFPDDPAPVMLDQKGCQYVPHVVALTTHTPLSVFNSDETNHNSAAISKYNGDWNQSQTIGGTPVQHVFSHPEVALSVKCNIHPWMKAYVAVFNHPYFQVTGPDGSFSLKNVPPGTYTLVAWQERYGNTEQQITVAPKSEQTVNLSFKARG
jgi:Carboxypeptidase regulatory-like domain